MKDINTLNQIVFDFDGNGVKEFGLNTVNDTLIFFEKDVAFTGPSTPLALRGNSLDSNLIILNFEPVPGADFYRIYRSDTTLNYTLYDSTQTNSFNDVNVLNRKNYYYKVSAVDLQNPVQESILSNGIMVYCHNLSRLVTAIYENDGFLTLKFSERVPSTIPMLSSFNVSNAVGTPKTVAIKSNFEYFLSFETNLPNGNYSVKSNGLFDIYSSPVDSNSVDFTVNQNDSAKFYISKLELSGSNRLKVEFNLEVDSVSSRNVNNYTFEPFDIRVTSVEIDNSNRKLIYLNLQNNAVIGATGKNYLLKAYNVYSSDGIKIVDGAGSSFGLIFNKETLDEMYVYPNPYSFNSAQDYITFANTTRNVTVEVYDLTGKFLTTVTETDGNGGVEWNLTDKDGNKVPTGIYIYRATGTNSTGQGVEEKTGKFAVIK
jgi:hypothetical protein